MDDIHIQERVGCRLCGARKLFLYDGLCIKCLPKEYEQRGRMMRDANAASGEYLEQRNEALAKNEQVEAIFRKIIDAHDRRINEAMETRSNRCGCDACKMAREILEVLA